MPEAKIATEAILLAKNESGENGLLLTLLTPDRGILRAFKRTSARSKKAPPDLFDEASLLLNKAKTSDLWFVDEYIVLQRRDQIGRNYRAFQYACRYAMLLSRNIFDIAESPSWIIQLRRALDAWETGKYPEIVYFKALYLFAKQQGIPVKEDWLASLKEEGSPLRSVLRLPLADQTAAAWSVVEWIASLEDYLKKNYEVQFPA